MIFEESSKGFWDLDSLGSKSSLEAGILWKYYGDYVVPERVSMNEDLRNELTLLIHSLKLLGNYVLTLAEFEDVLDAVNDLKRASGENELAHISSIEPAVLVNGLRCEDCVFEISGKDGWASKKDFSLWIRFRVLCVSKLYHVSEHKFNTQARTSNVPSPVVKQLGAE